MKTEDISFQDLRCSKRAKRRYESKKRKRIARERIEEWEKPWAEFTGIKPDITDRWVGIRATTPKTCSCALCGNYRKYGIWAGKETRQEVLADLKLKEGLEEIWNAQEIH